MVEASHTALSPELRQLFFMIIVFCQVSRPSEFFERHWNIMADDIEPRLRRVMRNPTLTISSDDLRDNVLSLIDDLLRRYRTSLADKNLPLPRSESCFDDYDRMVREEMNYDRDELEAEHAVLVHSLNPQQKSIYKCILTSVEQADGQVFFVHSHGGTGKTTYLWRTVLVAVRLHGNIALAIASPAVDRSLRDIRGAVDSKFSSVPFGGITVVFCGDTRQILPVIPGGSKTNIINYTFCNSPLWSSCHVMHLTVNMRLVKADLDPRTRDGLEKFARWLIVVEASTDYFSQDEVSRLSTFAAGDLSPYPIEFLNTISAPGVSDHRLSLKVGCVVMLLRNVNQMSGLCNALSACSFLLLS
ncbi:DNA helicase PIF1, ATP-dependent [Corchorus olitorius]|uniref:ATP-dependent DNA helicase n=1 Tax=Corchorus olitorius TaxID=93759 RepID=A0A1R3FV43_9ROSI|nr:DNA helicase PIF1, ATP-dependent [Corchorus olitorius]